MTSNDGGQDGATRTLLRDLQALGHLDPRDHAFGADLRARLLRQAQAIQHEHDARPSPLRTGALPRRLGMRVACAVAAVLVTLGGVAGYLRLNGPTPAAAETMHIVRQAAAVLRLDANEAAHATYSITVTVPSGDAGAKGAGSLTGTADVWVQTDASGAPALSAQTLSMTKAGMTSRYIQADGHVYAYNPEMRGDNTILLDAGHHGMAGWVLPNSAFDGPNLAQRLSALTPPQVRALPQQTIQGHIVDVVEVDGWTDRPAQRTIFYVDAQSHQLQGFDVDSRDPSYPTPAWQARLTAYMTMPATDVPPGTFTLNAPSRAQLQAPDLGDPATFKGFQEALTATCHSATDLDLKRLLLSGQTLLAACQATAPGVTPADLVAALAAPEKAALNAALATGQITSAQVTAGLDAWQAWLTTFITTSNGAGK